MQVAHTGLARTARWLMLALVVSFIPAASHAGVFISVRFAPPPLVVYDQPPCPQPGWMWEPGYWAYGPGGYYWVPGTWVAAPEPGLYWTPGYWGFANAVYVWHSGYWGPHVGYYGGVNYGFGFFGVGFVGGMWRGREFAYNTAVVHVNNVVIRNTYVDRTVIVNHTVVNNHVAYSGGPGGIHHPPTAEERSYMNERHVAPTAFQTQHAQAALQNHNAYFNANHGHPQQTAVERPMVVTGRRSYPTTSHPVGRRSYPTSSQQQPGQGNGSNHQPGRAYQESKMGGQNPLYEHNEREQTARPHNGQQPQQHTQGRPQPQSGPPRQAQHPQPRPAHPQQPHRDNPRGDNRR